VLCRAHCPFLSASTVFQQSDRAKLRTNFTDAPAFSPVGNRSAGWLELRYLRRMAPEVGLEPTTLRLTEQSYGPESQCYQWTREEPEGQNEALSARNSAKFSAKT
jgi:hypothetical protein